ncbi:MAG: glycosyltransferase family 2 protein, partial [Acidobacteriota bacterium]
AVSAGRPGLSAIVPTFNEEGNVRDCLAGLSFADEILVVDSFSTDATVEIAKSFPKARILQHEYFGNGPQCNWAMERAEHPWILIVDADERVPPELAREIEELLARGPEADQYRLRRDDVFFGRVVRHGGLAAHGLVRLLRKGSAWYPNKRVHADVETRGRTPVLRQRLTHYTYRSFGDYVEKLRRYAEWGAADRFRKGRRAGFFAVAFHPAWRFLRMYVLQAGFLDGTAGLLVCGLQGYGTFLKYGRLWEWSRMERRGENVPLPSFEVDDSRPGAAGARSARP